MAAAPPARSHARVEFKRNTAATMPVFPYFPARYGDKPLARSPLNPALAVKTFQSQAQAESAAFPEGADLLIVAAPGESNLQAIVLILDAEAMPHGLPSVGERGRILVLVGEV